MANTKLYLVTFPTGYRVIAKVDGETFSYFSYATIDESLAKDVLNFTRKIVNAADETDDTPIFDFEVGETGDGDYMIMVSIDGVEHYLNVDTKFDACEIVHFLTRFLEAKEDLEVEEDKK